MQKLLIEIDTQLRLLDDNGVYKLPDIGEAQDIVRDYLNCRQEQRVKAQQQKDLRDLRELVETAIFKVESETQAKVEQAESAAKAKNVSIETAKAIKHLSKLDLCSPEAASALLTLTKIRRK